LKIVRCSILVSLSFTDSYVQNLLSKSVLGVFKDGSCKIFHSFFGLGTKLCLIESVFIFAEFSSIDLDDIIICEAKFILKEVNDDFSDCIPRLVGFINSQD
jgi:hypothetical protein